MNIVLENGNLSVNFAEEGYYSVQIESGTINNDGTDQYNKARARTLYQNKISGCPYVGIYLDSEVADIVKTVDLMTYEADGTFSRRAAQNTAVSGQQTQLTSSEAKWRASIKFTDERNIGSSELATLMAHIKVVISSSSTRPSVS